MPAARPSRGSFVFDDDEDPVATFVARNRGVYDALQALLLDAAGVPAAAARRPGRHVRLLGGESQWQVLAALAQENGLVLEQHVGALRVRVPGQALELLVTADIGTPDPQPQGVNG